MTRVIRVGSRKSQLALIQTNGVVDRLKKCFPEIDFEIIAMTTTGDKILDTALSKIGEKSLFTRELETALLEKQVDFVVHSLKDLPTELPIGLTIGAVCKRDDPRDALVLRSDLSFDGLSSLPAGSVIGTSSLRRAAQIRRKYPHLQISDVRGNLNTRLRKLEEKKFDALVLAVAGLERMEWKDKISHVLEPNECLYAVSQGAIAVECRALDEDILCLLAALTDFPTLISCVAERAFLRHLEGGCSVPVAVHTEIKGNELTLSGGVFSIGGTDAVLDSMTAQLSCISLQHKEVKKFTTKAFAAVIASEEYQTSLEAAEQLGIDLAIRMMASGADVILSIAKKQTAEEIMKQKAKSAALKELDTLGSK